MFGKIIIDKAAKRIIINNNSVKVKPFLFFIVSPIIYFIINNIKKKEKVMNYITFLYVNLQKLFWRIQHLF